MAVPVKDMSEDPVCDNHQFQINVKIMTSVHNRSTKPLSAAVSWTDHHSAHRTDKRPWWTLRIWLENSRVLISPELKLWHVFTLFPPCLHRPAGVWALQLGVVTLRRATEPLMMWTDLICSVKTERWEDGGETWWPCGAQWCHPGTGWAAGWQATRCTTATICCSRYSSLSRGPPFLTEQGAPTGWNNEQYN